MGSVFRPDLRTARRERARGRVLRVVLQYPKPRSVRRLGARVTLRLAYVKRPGSSSARGVSKTSRPPRGIRHTPVAVGSRALVAPDSFKGTFDAPTVARALADGLREAGWETDVCPVADGGEGTLALLVEALGGELVEVAASDPLGRRVACSFGLVDDGATAIVEMAQASGLARVAPHERDAWRASTAGTGELILAAAGTGATEILVAVGGSATTDGGAGAIEAIRAGGGIGDARLRVLCDVESAFEDAPRIFGPQKGADRALIVRLEERLATLAATLPRDPRGLRFGGCAGGLSGGLWAAFGAELCAGRGRGARRARRRRADACGAARRRGRGLPGRAELRRQDRRRARAPRGRGGRRGARGRGNEPAVGRGGRARGAGARLDGIDARGDQRGWPSAGGGLRPALAFARPPT